MIEIIKNISVIVSLILSTITLATLIIKPFKKIKNIIETLVSKINDLTNTVTMNEQNRLRGELFNCGNRCRRNIPLHQEEFRFIQGVYQEYSEELHCNGIGKEEYLFIEEYLTDNIILVSGVQHSNLIFL